MIDSEGEKLTPEGNGRLEVQCSHLKFHFVLFFFVTLLLALFSLWMCKRTNPRLYNLASIFWMWISPAILSPRFTEIEFSLTVWLIFSAITFFIVIRAFEKPIKRTTPRLVYKLFYFTYKSTFILGICGYILMTAIYYAFIIGFYPFSDMPPFWVLIRCMTFNAFYYRLLAVDIAEFCTEEMAAKIGYDAKEGISSRSLDKDVCALCGNRLQDNAGEGHRGEHPQARLLPRILHPWMVHCRREAHLPLLP
jgi:RING finger protein 121/175